MNCRGKRSIRPPWLSKCKGMVACAGGGGCRGGEKKGTVSGQLVYVELLMQWMWEVS